MTSVLAASTTNIKYALSAHEGVEYAYPEVEPSVTLTPPLGFSAKLYSTGSGKWVAEDAVSGIFGCGDTADVAVRDFLAAAREHLDVLEASGQLAPHLDEQLKYLRARLS